MSDETEVELDTPSPPPVEIEVSPQPDVSEVITDVALYLEVLPPPEIAVDVYAISPVEEVEVSEPTIIIQGGGGLASLVTGEVPTGAINGSNVDYITANVFQIGSLEVFVNGLRMRVTWDYNITGSKNFRMIIALLTGDNLVVDYILP